MSSSRKWALLIGIDQYERAAPLRFARADARGFADVLRQVYGFPAGHVTALVDGPNSREYVTSSGIIAALEAMAGQVKEEDTFLFYFAGHGIVRGAESYLLGIDADLSSRRQLQSTSIPVSFLRETLTKIPARHKIIIVDACRNDPVPGRYGRANQLEQAMRDSFQDIIGGPRVATAASPAAAMLLFACDVGQRAWEWEEKGHSVFAYYLIEALRGGAAEPDGKIEFSGVASYVRGKLEAWSRHNRERPQRAIFEAKGLARLVLTTWPGFPIVSAVESWGQPQWASRGATRRAGARMARGGDRSRP